MQVDIWLNLLHENLLLQFAEEWNIFLENRFFLSFKYETNICDFVCISAEQCVGELYLDRHTGITLPIQIILRHRLRQQSLEFIASLRQFKKIEVRMYHNSAYKWLRIFNSDVCYGKSILKALFIIHDSSIETC